MSYQIALAFEDGVTRFITCEPGQYVADASYRARIHIPLDCRGGACGACKVYVESGEYDRGDYIEEALSAAEAEQGYVLACQMRPESDCIVQIPTDSSRAKTAAASYTATITALTRHSDSMIGLDIEVDDAGDLVFLPGQYVNVVVPGGDGATRSYSLSSGPGDGRLSLLVKIVDGGLMSQYLAERARVGDTFEIRGPFGSFFLRDLRRPTLLLAGGAGLAPILSMLSKILADGGSGHPLRVLYGVNVDADLAHLDDLEAYTQALDDFSYDYVVGDEASSHRHRGYVTALIDDVTINHGEADVYLCGPPRMVESVRQHFGTLTRPPASFFFEKFTGNVGSRAIEVTRTVESQADPSKAQALEAVAAQHAALADQPYEVGQEYATSDERYDARSALELAVVSLTIGRLSADQLTAFRLLADETAKHVDGERIIDGPRFITANAAYHDFLFDATGNPHLLQAYLALGVRQDMERTLHSGSWISEGIIREHYELVDAFVAADADEARRIVISHAAHSKQGQRRARQDDLQAAPDAD